jgi:hypothetical protein
MFEFEAQLLAQQEVQKQKILAIHRHNLEVYQQMLAGCLR